MSFREFTANVTSIRDFKETTLDEKTITAIKGYVEEINASIDKEKGFSFIMLENGESVFDELKGIGGYHGVMIKSPHYIGLAFSKDEREAEFYGAYYMQSLVKKLYEMKLGSCWVNVRKAPASVLQNSAGSINYLLAFGMIDEKAVQQKAPHMTVSNAASTYKQDPYGTKVSEISSSDRERHSFGEIVYLYDWGKPVSHTEMENRGLSDIFYYVRNAPSYKNQQPCRFILKDGKAELAIINPDMEESYIDAGIMMYTMEGLAKDLGIPSQWEYVNGGSYNNEFKVVAKISL